MSGRFSAAATAAQISVDRHGDLFRLAFPYQRDLVAKVRELPHASYDPDTRTWTVAVCQQSVATLRQWHQQDLVDTNVDDLVREGEQLTRASSGTLTSHAGKFCVTLTIRDDATFARLRSVVGAHWDKKLQGFTYPSSSAAALSELVDKGVLADPEGILTSTSTCVMFDARTGRFTVSGSDRRAQEAFDKYFPDTDVVARWKDKGLPVDFLDPFTESMYKAELARYHPLDTPEGFTIELYPHQRTSYSMAVSRNGHAVFDEPGLGKSATAIAAGYTLLQREDIPRVVVVVPASVRSQWRSEIERFTNDTSIVVISGDKKERHQAYRHAVNARWVIVHYDVLARDKKELRPLFEDAYVIADEAHRVKSRAAARTKALRELSHKCRGRLALTGTPVETSPEEWFEIISGWAIPGCLGTGYEFNERYRWKNRWGGYEGARNIHELRQRSEPFYTRHTKKEVASFLPPLSVHHKVLDPSAAYAAALRKAHNDAVEEIRKNATAKKTAMGSELTLLDEGEITEISDGAEMTATGLLRLLCSSPRIVQASDSASAGAMRDAGLIPDDDGPKVEEIRALAAGLKTVQNNRLSRSDDTHTPTPADVTGERMVVFTFSKRMANLLSERLEEDGVEHVLYTGDTSPSERDRAVAAFTDPQATVQVFISTDAGAEGLNLGRCCNLLVNADLPWTAARMAQRAQRIHRLDGTADTYTVINLTIAGTIESGIVKLLESRADLTDALFGEEGSRMQATGRRNSKNLFLQALHEAQN